jgi:hypothetical protein
MQDSPSVFFLHAKQALINSIDDIVASVAPPVNKLKGLKRISLKPGEQETVTFNFPADDLAFQKASMKRKVEPGMFKPMLGHSSDHGLREGEFEVTVSYEKEKAHPRTRCQHPRHISRCTGYRCPRYRL